MLDHYLVQVRLLMSVLPDIAKEDAFALKGGTAINLFYRDMPRLSVDIDLAYLPTGDRETALKDIDEALDRIVAGVARRNPEIQARRMAGGGNSDTRIVLSDGRARIKVETSPVTRGTVLAPTMMTASDAVMERFGFAETRVLAFEDLYGGKLHAALDRRHPRDLFDVKLLYDNEGLSEDLFRVFMVYVASSSRPLHELLAPTAALDDALYDEEFVGMTRDTVTKEELLEAGRRLHADIRERLTGDIAAFLISLHDAEPDFDRIRLPEAAQLPAVRWKLRNLARLKRDNPDKHAMQRQALERLFK